ncbi:SCO7613 C-terminal domain-containing membrane protein [Virgisporangium aliadipatigenens]|nr:hypothetical protein [Virgisporangium aliadipatigenens]
MTHGMTGENSTAYACPRCGAVADIVRGCRTCGSPPEPEAPEVARLRDEIDGLSAEAQTAWLRHHALLGQLGAARGRFESLLGMIRQRSLASAAGPVPVPPPGFAPPSSGAPAATAPAPGPYGGPVPSGPSGPAVPGGPGVGGVGVGGGWPAHHSRGPAPEASPLTVQTLLFVLGGLLLGAAAIVFTAVAWANFGAGGRAAILTAFTVLALAVGPIARQRGLAGTGETFAALGLLLVLLDGCAARLLDVAAVDAIPLARYIGGVCGATALIAAGYAAATGLVGPRFVALLIAQPVLPLLVAEQRPSPAGWVAAFAIVAGLDATAATVGSRWADVSGAVRGFRVTGWLLFVPNAALAGILAVLAFAGAGRSEWVGSPLLAATLLAAVLGYAGARSRNAAVAALLTAVAVAGWTGGAARVIAVSWPGYATVGIAALTLSVALAVALPAAVAPVAGGPGGAGGGGGTSPGVLAGGVVSSAASVAGGPGPGGLGVAVAWSGGVLGAIRRGAMAGVLFVAGCVALVLANSALTGAAFTAALGLPAWRDGADPARLYDWQLPVSLVLVAGAFAVALWRIVPRGRAAVPAPAAVGIVGGALVVFAVPVSFATVWWTPSFVDGLVAVPLALAAARVTSRRAAHLCGAGAGVLVAHAVLVGLGRPAGTAGVLAGVVALGIVVGWFARVPAVRAVTVAAVVLAVPALAAALGELLAAPAVLLDTPVASVCAVVASVGVAGGLAVPRVAREPWAMAGGFASAAAGAGVTVAAVAVPGVPFGVVAAVELLCAVALALVLGRRVPGGTRALGAAALPVGGALAVAVAPTVGALLFGPYRWAGEVWSGAVVGVGLAPGRSGYGGVGGPFGVGPAAVSLAILTVVVGLVARAYATGRIAASAGWAPVAAGAPEALSGPHPAPGGTVPADGAAPMPAGVAHEHRPLWTVLRATLPLATLTALAACAALGAQWPAVPIVSLAGGLAAVVLAAFGPRPERFAVGGVLAWGSVAAGLAGSLATRPMTLSALGAIVAVGGICGAVGRSVPVRVTGWLVAGASGVALGLAAGRAADLPLHLVAYCVLGAAAVLLAGSAVVRRRPEWTVLEAAGHAGAAVAFLLAGGRLGHAAGVCGLWGIAVGLRALRAAGDGRRSRVVAATLVELLAYWYLLAANDVALVEAYTVPSAAAAVFAGWTVAKRRPGLSSWSAYGAALLAGFGPSVASGLAQEGDPVRRLALGVAAVAVVLVGAKWRLRAPFVVGGAVLVLVAFHEMVLIWDLVPRWAPLAIGGLALVAVATTYERRRRDLDRLRGAVARMR